MSALAFYPDASPETTTVDGYIYSEGSSNWATVKAGNAQGAGDASTVMDCRCDKNGGTNYALNRSIYLFDTTVITDSETIDIAKLDVFVETGGMSTGASWDGFLCATNPASNTAVVVSDWGSFGTTKYSDALDGGAVVENDYNSYTLNSSGISAISKTGVTKLGAQEQNDIENSAPTETTVVNMRSKASDFTGTTSDPKLTVMSGADTVDSYYPDPSPETTTVDGSVARRTANQVWSSIIAGAGTNQYDGTAQWLLAVYTASTTSNQWDDLFRSIMLFDTTAIGSDTVNAGTISIFGYSKADTTSSTPDGQIYGSTPATNTALVSADYGQTGSTAFSDAVVSYANFSITNYNNWTLNASGRSAITAGVSKFSFKSAKHDVANSSPTWGSGIQSGLYGETAEATGTTKDPVLVVSHSAGGATIRIINLSLLGVG